MTDKQAAKKARVIWGANGAVQCRPNAPDAAARKDAADVIRRRQNDKTSVTPADFKRSTEKALLYRCNVGETSSFAFHVRGQGDTWEEAFAAAEAKAEYLKARDAR